MTTKNLYTIALDCDGVLFDCNDYVRRLAQRICTDRELPPKSEHHWFEFDKSLKLSRKEMSQLHSLVADSTATRDMEWFDGAREFVDALRTRGHDVFFLTSHWRGCHSWVPLREARLNLNWPKCDVVFTHSKHRAQFDYLVDDKLETVMSIGAAGILFDQPWNQHAPDYVRRVKSYEEILQFLDTEVQQ